MEKKTLGSIPIDTEGRADFPRTETKGPRVRKVLSGEVLDDEQRVQPEPQAAQTQQTQGGPAESTVFDVDEEESLLGEYREQMQNDAAEDTETVAEAAERGASSQSVKDTLRRHWDMLQEQRAAKKSGPEVLRNNARGSAEMFQARMRQSELLDRRSTRPERVSELSGMHQIYAASMALNCLQEFRSARNASEIASVVGMTASMWAMSPNFRTFVKESALDVSDTLMDTYREKMEAFKDKRNERLGQKVAKDERKAAKTGKTTTRMEDRSDKLHQRETGRLRYTPESAALIEVGLNETLFNKLRSAKADPEHGHSITDVREALKSRHQYMVDELYTQATEDGLTTEDIARATRTLVGQRAAQEPGVSTVYSELAQGRIRPGAGRVHRAPGAMAAKTVWDGQYEDAFGNPVTGGTFTVRDVMTADEHQKVVSDAMLADMISVSVTPAAVQRGEAYQAEALNNVLTGYALGWAASGDDELAARFRGKGKSERSVKTAKTMVQAMDTDGFDPMQQQKVYSNALMDALDQLEEISPALAQSWEQKYSKNWRSEFKDFVDDPETFFTERKKQEKASASKEYTAGQRNADGTFVAGYEAGAYDSGDDVDRFTDHQTATTDTVVRSAVQYPDVKTSVNRARNYQRVQNNQVANWDEDGPSVVVPEP